MLAKVFGGMDAAPMRCMNAGFLSGLTVGVDQFPADRRGNIDSAYFHRIAGIC